MTGKQWALGVLATALISCGGYLGLAIIQTQKDVEVMKQAVIDDVEDHEFRIRPLERGYIDHELRIRSLEASKEKRP